MVGSNQHQKLGIKGKTILDIQNKFVPVELLGSLQIVRVACSFFHTMALTSEGRIYTWGGTLAGKRGQGKEIRGAGEKYEPMELLFFRQNKLHVTAIACG